MHEFLTLLPPMNPELELSSGIPNKVCFIAIELLTQNKHNVLPGWSIKGERRVGWERKVWRGNKLVYLLSRLTCLSLHRLVERSYFLTFLPSKPELSNIVRCHWAELSCRRFNIVPFPWCLCPPDLLHTPTLLAPPAAVEICFECLWWNIISMGCWEKLFMQRPATNYFDLCVCLKVRNGFKFWLETVKANSVPQCSGLFSQMSFDFLLNVMQARKVFTWSKMCVFLNL